MGAPYIWYKCFSLCINPPSALSLHMYLYHSWSLICISHFFSLSIWVIRPLDEKKVKLEVGRPVGKLLQHCLQEKMMAKQMESQEQWRDILVMVTELCQWRIMDFHFFKDIFGSFCIFFLYVFISKSIEISKTLNLFLSQGTNQDSGEDKSGGAWLSIHKQ